MVTWAEYPSQNLPSSFIPFLSFVFTFLQIPLQKVRAKASMEDNTWRKHSRRSRLFDREACEVAPCEDGNDCLGSQWSWRSFYWSGLRQINASGGVDFPMSPWEEIWLCVLRRFWGLVVGASELASKRTADYILWWLLWLAQWRWSTVRLTGWYWSWYSWDYPLSVDSSEWVRIQP